MRLHSAVREAATLRRDERDAMFALMTATFANKRRGDFDADLSAKQWIIEVREPHSARLVGFSTQTLLRTRVSGEPVEAIYSGDTVVQRDCWGDMALASAWGSWALEWAAASSCANVVWFLTSKGFRTYRYLPLFFRRYFPRVGAPAHDPRRRVVDALAAMISPQRYDADAGVLRATANGDYVRRGISEPGRRVETDPHVQFFVERNPGYAQGDELCCVAPLNRDNLTRAGIRMIEAAGKRLQGNLNQ